MADEREFLLAQHTHWWARMEENEDKATDSIGSDGKKKHENWMKWKLNSHLWREPSDLNKTKTLANAHGTTNRKISAPLPIYPGSLLWRMCPPMADGNHFIHSLACWVYARVHASHCFRYKRRFSISIDPMTGFLLRSPLSVTTRTPMEASERTHANRPKQPDAIRQRNSFMWWIYCRWIPLRHITCI